MGKDDCERPAGRSPDLSRAMAELRQRGVDGGRELERLRRAVESMEDGLFVLDPAGKVILANKAARGVLDALDAGLHQVDPTACSRRRCGRPMSCRQCLVNPDQFAQPAEFALGERIYEIRATRLGDFGQPGEEQVFVCRDVTERKRQEALEAHQERLTVLGEVAAVIAHEMNNPLAAVSMFSQMLLDELDATSPLHTHAEVIHRNTLGCKRTLRSLLDMAAAAPRAAEEFDVRDLLDGVIELLEPVARHSRVALQVDIEVADGRLHGDELRLRQALINLVMNGIQATEKGEGGEVTVGIFDRGGELVVRVRDNGPGIPAEVQGRIFELFFTTKPAGQGTGLGLPTARQVAEAHGGRLTLAASSSAGTTFEIVLPRSIAAVQGAAPEARAREGKVA